MEYIPRLLGERIINERNYYQVIVITGPRQTGKTTLCRHLFPDYNYYNLEDGVLREAVKSDPKGFVNESGSNVIFDEIQRMPELFSYIQLCVDDYPDRRFVITGSSDFSLMENISQSLAGRAGLYTLLPFSFKEIKSYIESCSTESLMFNGYYPGTIVKGIPPLRFYSNYISTYVERDVRQLKAVENLDTFRIFLRLLAGRVGSEFNASSLSIELGVSAPTVRSWLGILKTSYIIFSLPPYYANIGKRLTKTPKIYFYDSGLLCNLLGISEKSQLEVHPLKGMIFENLAVGELIKEKYNEGGIYDICFYRENSGREIDVMKINGLDIELYEIKSSKIFNKNFTRNFQYIKEILNKDIKRSVVVYDGPTVMPVAENIREL